MSLQNSLEALTSTVNLLAADLAPREVIPHLCGAFFLAMKKKGVGHRPIAVGEVLRRLTSKCLSTAVRAEVIRILTPLQVGVGVREGCEAIIHSVARTLEREDLAPDSRWILLLDFSNAFNSISWECMFEEIRSRIPSLSRWVESCYGAQPILHMAATQFLVVVESNKGTLWALCALLSRSSLLLRN